MAAGKKQYVYRLMKAKCSCGDQKFEQNLNLPLDHGVIYQDAEHPLMNANDHVSGEHILTFGRCKSTSNPGGTAGFLADILTMGIGSEILQSTIGTPCKPMTVTPWINVDEDYFIDGAPALTIESTLPCYYGGIITIVVEKTESTDSEGDNASEEDKDIKDQLPSEVQEKIDSFTDAQPSNPQSAAEEALAASAAEVSASETGAEVGMISPTNIPRPGFDEMIEYAKGIIPQRMSNDTMLKAFDFMSSACPISSKTIESNAEWNVKELTQTDENGESIYIPKAGSYIENQSQWENVKFGCSPNSNMSYSGCEIIATYNALSALGESTSADTMVNMISTYEKDGAALFGEFGTSPHAIENYMKDAGYQVQTTTSTDAEKINAIGDNSDVIIATVYNDKNNITGQIHTVCITKTPEGNYVAHNTGKYNGKKYEESEKVSTLNEAINQISTEPQAINIVGVKK